MKKHKKFDCVQMKWDIQQEIAKEAMGISAKEFNRIQMEKIAKNPILGQFLNKVCASTERKKESIEGKN
jgi:hypothetical protein